MQIGRAAALVLTEATHHRPCILIGKDTRASVSYTHLDVYKRQSVLCAASKRPLFSKGAEPGGKGLSKAAKQPGLSAEGG